MERRALGYVRIEATDLDAWRRFAVEGLGMDAVEGSDATTLRLRVDDRWARIVVTAGESDRLLASGWELPGADALGRAVRALEAAGFPVKEGTADECAERRVELLVHCDDPAGNHLELVVGPALDHAPLTNPYGTRFVTGDMGLGHVVLGAPDMAAAMRFYTEVLGFHLRDSMRLHHSVVPGRTEAQGDAWMRFLGCNPRHHSLGLFEAALPNGIVHLMVEVETLDDVGRALDRVQGQGARISATLGRHTNDHMVSFYVQSPGGFDVEYGTGARVVDPATWTATEITAVSFWGHKFGTVYDH